MFNNARYVYASTHVRNGSYPQSRKIEKVQEVEGLSTQNALLTQITDLSEDDSYLAKIDDDDSNEDVIKKHVLTADTLSHSIGHSLQSTPTTGLQIIFLSADLPST